MDLSVYQLSGSVMTSAPTIIGVPSGSTNYRNAHERRLYDRLLLGKATMADVGEGPSNLSASSPSWTLVHAGKLFAYVIGELSSSDHEVTSMNAFRSGTQALETSPVPASGTLYYSKLNRFRKLMYKLTASAGLPETPVNDRSPSEVEYTGSRGGINGTFHPVSGSYRNNSIWSPSEFVIDVPDYGKIRDVKVWLEFVHDHRTGPGIVSASVNGWGGTGDVNINRRQGLQGVQIALRSPNVNFYSAHPLLNDERLSGYEKRPDATVPRERDRKIPELYKGTYLLWAGHAVEDDLGLVLGEKTSSFYDLLYVYLASIASSSDNAITANLYARSLEGLVYIKLDKSNRPHFTYISKTVGGMHYVAYAKMDNTTTSVNNNRNHVSIEEVTASWKSASPILSIDKKGNPAVAYHRNESGTLAEITTSTQASDSIMYVLYDDTLNRFYNHEVVCVSPAGKALNPFKGISAARLSNDDVLLAYITGSNLAVSKRTASTPYSGSWDRQIVSNLGQETAYHIGVSISVDENDVAHLLASNYMQDGLQYVKYFTSSSVEGWTQKHLDIEGSKVLAIKHIVSASSMHIAYSEYTSDLNGTNVKYVLSNSSGLVRHTLTNSGVNISAYPFLQSMTLNKVTGKPMILYADTPPSGLIRLTVASLGEFGFSQRYIHNMLLLTANGSHGACIDTDNFGNVHFVVVDNSSSIRYYAQTGSLLLSLTYGTSQVQRSLNASSSLYHSFNTDIDMRTIFDDSSVYLNPREASVNPLGRLVNEGQYSSPSSASLFGYMKYENFGPVFDTDHSMTGSNVPWMMDDRIAPGILFGRDRNFATGTDGVVMSSSLFPIPKGWIVGDETGPVTYGLQLGPQSIRPVYPMLDDIVVEKTFTDTSYTSNSYFTAPADVKFQGKRPGLRGSEVHGRWKLLIGNNANFITGEPTGSIRDGIWFRQFRLEFTIDLREMADDAISSQTSYRSRKAGYVSGKPSVKRFIGSVSGSAAWDIGLNSIYVELKGDHGRSYGITSNRSDNEFAVYTSITGAFADTLSGSGKLTGVLNTFLRNEFGTPYIPLSSGSSATPEISPFTIDEINIMRKTANDVLNPTTLIPKDNTDVAELKRTNAVESAASLIVKKIQDE